MNKRRGFVKITFKRFPTLSAQVRQNCLAVYANDDEGQYYDRILDLDSLPEPISGSRSVVCKLCDKDQRIFASREALWIDHLFEPFAEWVHASLLNADGVEYHDIHGMTWAKLRMKEPVSTKSDAPNHLRFFRAAEAS